MFIQIFSASTRGITWIKPMALVLADGCPSVCCLQMLGLEKCIVTPGPYLIRMWWPGRDGMRTIDYRP